MQYLAILISIAFILFVGATIELLQSEITLIEAAIALFIIGLAVAFGRYTVFPASSHK